MHELLLRYLRRPEVRVASNPLVPAKGEVDGVRQASSCTDFWRELRKTLRRNFSTIQISAQSGRYVTYYRRKHNSSGPVETLGPPENVASSA